MANDINKEKLQLIEWILQQDKATALRPLLEAITHQQRDEADALRIVGYKSKGARVTRKELVQSIIATISTLDHEKLLTLEAVEQESDKW